MITAYLEVPNRSGDGVNWLAGPFFFQDEQTARQAIAEMVYPQLESWLGVFDV